MSTTPARRDLDRRSEPEASSPWLHAAILVVFGAFLTLPALANGYLPSRDVVIHLLWSSEFTTALLGGEPYPRWLTGMNAGLGSPAFFFYGPLPYYATALLRPLVGSDPEGWHQITLAAALAIMLSGPIVYAWLKPATGANAALVGALVYMSAPYHLAFDLYQRFAFGELWAFVAMPLVLIAVRTLAHDRPGGIAALAFAYAALALTHLPTLVIFSPVALAYAMSLAGPGAGLTRARHALAAMALGAGIAAIYLVPALATQQHVSFHAMREGYFHHSYNFLYFGPRHNPDFAALVHAQGWFAGVMIGLAVAAYAVSSRSMSTEGRRQARFWLAVASIAFLMMLPVAKPLWDLLPPLAAIQFPWRFNVLLTLATTALLAKWVGSLGERPRPLAIVLVLAACLAIIGQSFPTVTNYLALFASGGRPSIDRMLDDLGPLSTDAKAKFEAAKLRIDAPEYRPREVPVEAFGSAESMRAFLASNPSVEPTPASRAQCTLRHCRTVVSRRDTPGAIVVRQFHYPGWQAQLANGTPLAVRSSPGGLLTIDVPAGTHEIAIGLPPDALERTGQAISALSLLVALFLLFRRTIGTRGE